MTTLRPLTHDDADLLFTWRNQPDIIRLSASGQGVSREEHERWIAASLASPDRLVFIINANDEPCGVLRFDRDPHLPETCTVGIYLTSSRTGRGIGSAALAQGLLTLLQKWPEISTVAAHVRKDNPASKNFFSKFGFVPSDNPVSPTLDCLHLDVQKFLLQKNSAFYGSLVNKHGLSHASLNWGSRNSQFLRFEVLAQVGDLRGRKILDLGCGTADFLAWLQEREITTDYTGLDVSEDMVTTARQRFPHARFLTGDLSALPDTEQFDYILESGIFTYSSKTYFHKTLALAFEKCRLAIAFNTLSAWRVEREPAEFYADPVETLAYCATLTKKLALRHDYHPGDFTVYLYKQPPA